MALLASGQLTASTSAQQLSATPCNPKKWILKALNSNTVQVGVGPLTQLGGAALSAANAYLLDPGDELEIDNTIGSGTVYNVTPDDIYVIAASGSPVLVWLAFG